MLHTDCRTALADWLSGEVPVLPKYEAGAGYYIPDTPVARWTCADAELTDALTFVFCKPVGSTIPDQPGFTTTWGELIQNGDESGISYDSERSVAVCGTPNAQTGWWECDADTLTSETTWAHGPIERDPVTLTFDRYVHGSETTPVWVATIPIVTAGEE